MWVMSDKFLVTSPRCTRTVACIEMPSQTTRQNQPMIVLIFLILGETGLGKV